MDTLETMFKLHIVHIEKELLKADHYILELKNRLYYFMKMNSSNSLKNLWKSAKDLWYRFKTDPPKPRDMLPLFIEESAEYVKEITDIIGSTQTENTVKNAAEEFADVITTGLLLYFSIGGTWEGLETAITNVCLKNDAKTHETHTVDPKTGIITRKDKLLEKVDADK